MTFKLTTGHNLQKYKASRLTLTMLQDLLWKERCLGKANGLQVQLYEPTSGILLPKELRTYYMHPSAVMSLWQKFMISQNLISNIARIKKVLYEKSIFGKERPCGVNTDMVLIYPLGYHNGAKVEVGMMEEWLDGGDNAAEKGNVFLHMVNEADFQDEMCVKIKDLVFYS